MTVIEHAQALGRRGFRVHPLKAKDQPYTPYSRTATADPDAIARLFAPFPHALIAIATGQGLVVVDDDRGLPEPDSGLLATLTSRTPSRGWHHYFSCPTPVRNSTGKVAEGIDIRGEGGYVVAPPSEGRGWVMPEWPIAPLPGLLLAACLREERSGATFEPRPHVPAGERHDYLVRFAGWALAAEMVDTRNDLFELVLEHALDVCDPWPQHELSAVGRHIEGICRWVYDRDSAAA